MKKMFFLASLLLTSNAYAEAVMCDRMKGSLLDITNKYVDIKFDAKQEIIQWSKDGDKILLITGDEQQEFYKVVDDDNYLRGVSMAGGAFILTYEKKNGSVFYSKHGLFLSQYAAKCKMMK